jgi:hypothetical protein
MEAKPDGCVMRQLTRPPNDELFRAPRQVSRWRRKRVKWIKQILQSIDLKFDQSRMQGIGRALRHPT